MRIYHGNVYLKVSRSTFNDNDTPLQYSCLENPMDGGAWWAAVHGVAKSRTWLSDFTFHFHALEKEMATHSSALDWRIPGMVGPGGLPSMGSHRVRHNWSDLAAAAAIPYILLMFTQLSIFLSMKTMWILWKSCEFCLLFYLYNVLYWLLFEWSIILAFFALSSFW